MINRSLLWALVALTAIGCQRKTYEYVYPTLHDGRYDSEFPYRSCSDQLDIIAASVKKIYSLVDYETYHFRPEDSISPRVLAGLPEEAIRAMSAKVTQKFDASNGTASIISYKDNRIALITCAHIIYFPDTLYTYFDDNDPSTKDFLYSISIQTNNRIFFTGYEEGRDLEVLALDRDLDLALVGKKTESMNELLWALEYPMGKSKQLEWGNFVYVMGFPLGYQMITRGIISKPVTRRDDFFLIDASFNEGFSGGIVLAIKDGVPNFELVGLGKSASATYENFLVPERENYEMIYNEQVPYEGKIYAEQKKTVNYGVTRAVSSHAMVRFYKDHRKDLMGKGYQLDSFFLAADEKAESGLDEDE